MRFSSLYRRAAQGLLVAALLTGGLAMAQAEPTINQIYATAQAGKLDQAQLMVQQVLISHPQSAKAHFVRAELYAREGKLERARESLAMAEKIAPGLPFAKPQAVQALRAQVSGRTLSPSASSGLSGGGPSTATLSTPTPAVHSGSQSAGIYNTPAAPSSSSWVLPLVLAGGVILAGYLFFRRRTPEPATYGGGYAPQGGLSGSQMFGMGGGMGGGAGGGYAPPAGSGMGGRILGGVATGLAVGAGVMAAEALGRNLMGHSSSNAGSGGHSNGNYSSNDYQSLNNTSNPDMGGADFGINDDGGGWDSGGGGDWDN